MKLKELSAEACLGLLYPELEKNWTVYDRGLFYRNYSEDIIAMDEEAQTVTLSRDGWLGYLPQELLSPENEILGKTGAADSRKMSAAEADREVRDRLRLLSESLVPFDTFNFRMRLSIERTVQEILGEKRDWILRTFYDFDMKEEHDEYVRKAALLLPCLPRIRGDIRFIRSLMETLLGHRVQSRYTTYGDTDSTRCVTGKVFLDIIIDGLDPDSYTAQMNRIHPLVAFLKERFLPVDLICEVGIRGRNPDVLMLDYNYEL